jgi:hypothetical protein
MAAHRFNHESTGHFTGPVAAHPVSDNIKAQPIIDEQSVLVVFSFFAGIGETGRFDDKHLWQRCIWVSRIWARAATKIREGLSQDMHPDLLEN